jgi:hypothetical protein
MQKKQDASCSGKHVSQMLSAGVQARGLAIDRCFGGGVDSKRSGTSHVYVRLSSLGPRQRIQQYTIQCAAQPWAVSTLG